MNSSGGRAEGLITIVLLFLLPLPLLAQYPFEKYPVPDFNASAPWQRYNKQDRIHWTATMPKFYGDTVPMTVQITTLANSDSSRIRIYKGRKQIQLISEPYRLGANFGSLEDSLMYGDVNGDGRADLRISAWYGGNGVASLNCRILYLFQKSNGTFDKISYMDKMITWGKERDLDGDRNFEILTTTLDYFEGHSYWTFNIYRFENGVFKNVNNEFNYPIMIQYLFRKNYAVTDKITPRQMKEFSLKLPEDFHLSQPD